MFNSILLGVNLKAVHRVWKVEGLRLKRRTRKRLKMTRSLRPELTAPNQAWCMDFLDILLLTGSRGASAPS
jgi:putative transposase